MSYTYRILFEKTNEYYYGARYKKRADPNELGVSYFSSSPNVQRKLFEHGIDHVKFEILGVFDNKEVCMASEYSLINEHKDEPLCLNKQGTREFGKKISKAHREGKYLNRNKQNSEKMKLMWADSERREKHIKSMNGRTWKLSEEQRIKISSHLPKDGPKDMCKGTIWINDKTVNKRIKDGQPIPEGFVKGRLFTPWNKR